MAFWERAMSICPTLVSQRIKTSFPAEPVLPPPHTLGSVYSFFSHYAGHALLPFFFLILLCLTNLTVSRWSLNCFPNTVRKVGWIVHDSGEGLSAPDRGAPTLQNSCGLNLWTHRIPPLVSSKQSSQTAPVSHEVGSSCTHNALSPV